MISHGVMRGGTGGGSGYTKTQKIIVSPGSIVPVSIGSPCSSTSVGSISCSGGVSGAASFPCGYGGSGGGLSSGRQMEEHGMIRLVNWATPGGSDGSYGGSNGSTSGGKGQGSTTRAFGQSNGTLYAGGGGGGGANVGAGGSGGGGNGGYCQTDWSSSPYSNPTAGQANTGGGGGGGGVTAPYYTIETIEQNILNNIKYGKPGGSGIAIIRWGY